MVLHSFGNKDRLWAELQLSRKEGKGFQGQSSGKWETSWDERVILVVGREKEGIRIPPVLPVNGQEVKLMFRNWALRNGTEISHPSELLVHSPLGWQRDVPWHWGWKPCVSRWKAVWSRLLSQRIPKAKTDSVRNDLAANIQLYIN